MRNLYLFCTLAILCLYVQFANQVPVSAQANVPITITTKADLTGNSGTQQVTATPTTCREIQFVALAANTAAIRMGDASTAVSQGLPIAAGGVWNRAQNPNINFVHRLDSYYFYGVTGDKLSVTCEN
jgi:hypothetical protein